MKVGDVVLLMSSNTSRGQWPLGRIVEVKAGKDNHVRVVKVKTGNSLVLRPITQICPLEFEHSQKS